MLSVLLLVGLPIFFIYVFPFFFSSITIFDSYKESSMIFFGIGILSWLLFNWIIYKKLVLNVSNQYKIATKATKEGRVTKATIVESSLVGKENGSEVRNLIFQFKNYNNSDLFLKYNLTDTKPHEKRFVEGKEVDLY